jgi:hypothetical protein
MRRIQAMKFWLKTFKNYSLNMLWVFMFIALWPIDGNVLLRVFASLLCAFSLAFFQTLFDDK